ncbi:MAG: carbonic anhydrase [Myxococcota bacterium]
MKEFEKLLLENKAWAEQKIASDPRYFERLARGQEPKFLWIGSSDSRVPPLELTGAEPGDMIVHRNIANLVIHTDLNLMSVVQYAVEALKVEHVIVCGEYGCEGIKSALSQSNLGLLNKWLRHIKDIYRNHSDELLPIKDDPDKLLQRMVEINVQEQVTNLAHTSIIQRSWKQRRAPILHGWVYGLEDGRLRSLVNRGPDEPVDPIYAYGPEEL